MLLFKGSRVVAVFVLLVIQLLQKNVVFDRFFHLNYRKIHNCYLLNHFKCKYVCNLIVRENKFRPVHIFVNFTPGRLVHVLEPLCYYTTFPIRLHVCLARSQITLLLPVGWSESSLSVRRRFGCLAPHRVSCKDTDRLRGCAGWPVDAGRTIRLVGKAVFRLV